MFQLFVLILYIYCILNGYNKTYCFIITTLICYELFIYYQLHYFNYFIIGIFSEKEIIDMPRL